MHGKHAKTRLLSVEIFSQLQQSHLAARVRAHAWCRKGCAQRANDDKRAGCYCLQIIVYEIVRSLDVDLKVMKPCTWLQVTNWSSSEAASSVDNDVDGTECVNSLLEKGLNIDLFVQICDQTKNLGSRADGANSAGRLFE